MASEGVSELERLLSLRDTQMLLDMSEMTVLRLIRSGELPVVRIGRRTLVEPEGLRALIARHRVPNDDGPAVTGPSVRTSAGEDGGVGSA